MKKIFESFLEKMISEAGGQEAGKLELVKSNINAVKDFADSIGVLDQIPDFDKNFKFAQSLAKVGRTQRKDMPVITDDDVKELQKRLKGGYLDVNEPYSKYTDSGDPFPEGLSGKEAEFFLQHGLKDGHEKDDVVKVITKQIKVKDLKPIQQQIYVDKSLQPIADFGIEASINFYTNKTTYITSSDYYIIDGHHRFFGAALIDPDLKVTCLVIDLPLSKLLPLTLAYGDAIGNQRNESLKITNKFGDPTQVFFKMKKDKHGRGKYEETLIHDNITKIEKGKIYTEDGYIFDEKTLYLIDDDYYVRFPYEKVKLHVSTRGYL
jgi:hypothetical protein